MVRYALLKKIKLVVQSIILNCKVAGLRIRIHFIRIRIQHLRMNTNPDPDPIQIQGFNDQKLKKNYKVIEEAFSSQKRPSNTSKHERLQFFFYFSGSFLPSWIRISNPYPDTLTRNPIESGSNPDPQPCPQYRFLLNLKTLKRERGEGWEVGYISLRYTCVKKNPCLR